MWASGWWRDDSYFLFCDLKQLFVLHESVCSDDKSVPALDESLPLVWVCVQERADIGDELILQEETMYRNTGLIMTQ